MYSKTIKTIDLSAFIEKTFEIRMVDGRVLNVKRPTKGIMIQLQNVCEAEIENREPVTREFIFHILNNNTENVTIEKSEVDEMPAYMIIAIFNAYMEFINELVSNPNS